MSRTSRGITDGERRRLIAKLNAELKDGIGELDRGEAIDGDELDRSLSETIERHRRDRRQNTSR